MVQNYHSVGKVISLHVGRQTRPEEMRLVMVNFRSLFDKPLKPPAPK